MNYIFILPTETFPTCKQVRINCEKLINQYLNSQQMNFNVNLSIDAHNLHVPANRSFNDESAFVWNNEIEELHSFIYTSPENIIGHTSVNCDYSTYNSVLEEILQEIKLLELKQTNTSPQLGLLYWNISIRNFENRDMDSVLSGYIAFVLAQLTKGIIFVVNDNWDIIKEPMNEYEFCEYYFRY